MRRPLNAFALDDSMNTSRLLTLLVVFDLATKAAALWLLPDGRRVDQDALLQFVLSRNASGIGTWGKAAMTYSSLPETAGGAFGYVGLSIALITTSDWGRRRRRNLLVCVAAFAMPSALGVLLAPGLSQLPHETIVVVLRGAGVLFALTVWRLVPSGLWKLALTLLAAAALGNFLSLLYPPFQIIDFMYSSVADLTFRYGVFNLADLYIPVGWTILAVAACRGLVRSVSHSRHSDHNAQDEIV